SDLSDRVPRFSRKESRVDLPRRKKREDELLVLLAKLVGFPVIHVGEPASDRLPERRLALLVERRQELGQDLFLEAGLVEPEEKKANERDLPANARFGVPLLRIEDQ